MVFQTSPELCTLETLQSRTCLDLEKLLEPPQTVWNSTGTHNGVEGSSCPTTFSAGEIRLGEARRGWIWQYERQTA